MSTRSRMSIFSGSKFVFLLLGVHSLLWVVIPTLVQPNANLDVVEGLVWGQELQWGYDKHPFLTPWLTYLFSLLSGGTNWPVFLVSQLCVVTTVLMSWRLALEYLERRCAALSALLLLLIPYFNYVTPEFNPNILQLPLWAAVILSAYFALQRRSLGYWLLLGVFAGLALSTKYYAVVLLVSILGVLLLPARWWVWRTAGPYLALLATLLVWGPNLFWLIEHEWVTVSYGVARGGDSASLASHLIHPLKFVLSQVAVLVPLVLVVSYARRTGETNGLNTVKRSLLPQSDRAFLWAVTAGPLLVTLLLSLVTGMKLRSMWGTPLLTFMPLALWVFAGWVRQIDRRRLLRGGLLVSAFYLLVFVAEMALLPEFGKQKKRAHFPGAEMATALTQRWHDATGQPLEYVIGSIWLGGNLAYYSPDHPSVLFDGDPQRSPWFEVENAAHSGALIVWNLSMDGEADTYQRLLKDYPSAVRGEVLEFSWPAQDQPPVRIGWAIVPPVNQLSSQK